MYSMVMMLAMTTAPDVPACGRRGGCSGGGCYGGGGGCYGSNYGGCYGGYGYGGCSGSGYGGYPRAAYSGSAVNGVYAYDGTGMPTIIYPTMSNQMPQDGIVGNSGPVNWQQIPGGNGTTKMAAPVKLEVIVPPDAKLSIDTVATDSKGAVRMFESPPLESGKEFFYRLTATTTRDGKELKAEKKVAVRAGQTTRATFDFQNAQPENISRPNRIKPDNSPE
jgi:uncharacterized protein (TIGR03000 family)